jgi:O-antigen/teichoic acid export membrane protein
LLIALGVLLALALGYAPDAATVLSIAIAATAGIVIVQTLIVRARIRKIYGDAVPGGPTKLWLAASLPLILTLGVDEIFVWSDILILGLMVPAEDVSIYFAAQRSMSLAAFVQFAFMLVMVRDFSLANARRDQKELQKRVSHATDWTFWLNVPAELLSASWGPPLQQRSLLPCARWPSRQRPDGSPAYGCSRAYLRPGARRRTRMTAI